MAKTPKQPFERRRRPGSLLFATVFLAACLVLALQIRTETQWNSTAKWSSHPALWPLISLGGMAVFASLNWIAVLVSQRSPGRWREAGAWLRSVEYVVWFMGYVQLAPLVGYLPATIVFAILLAVRAGYRSREAIGAAAAAGFAIVVVFKSFLQVRVPGSRLYEHLPDALRSFMITYF